MAIIGIVALSKDLAIGREGKLPWHVPADLKHFKATTSGNAVVMGRTTWLSIGRALPDRLNIVLSRSGKLDLPEGVMQLSSKDEVIDLARTLDRDVFIIGGAKTYAEFAKVIERWIVTDIPVAVDDADTFMPKDFLNGFELVETREIGDGLVVRMLDREHK